MAETLSKIIQLDESVDRPEGFTKVIIEGTGDEGGVDYMPTVTLTLSKRVVYSNGSDYIVLTPRVFDPAEPVFSTPVIYKDKVSFTEISIVDSGVKHGFLEAQHYILQVYGVYEYVGDDQDGEPLLTGDSVPMEMENGAIKFRYTRMAVNRTYLEQHRNAMPTQFVVHYKGAPSTASLNVGFNNTTWDEWMKVPEAYPEDKVWTAPAADVPGGSIVPETVAFYDSRNSAAYPSIGRSKYLSEIRYYPNNGDYGTTALNLKYKNVVVSETVDVIGTDFDLSLDAEPSSIALGEKSVLTLYVKAPGGMSPGNITWGMKQINAPNGVDEVGELSLSPTKGTLQNSDEEFEVTASDDGTITLPAAINSIASIELAGSYTEDSGFSWTWSRARTTFQVGRDWIHIEEGYRPASGLAVIVKANVAGVGKSMGTGMKVGSCEILGRAPDLDVAKFDTTNVTVTKADAGLKVDLKADDDTLDLQATTNVTAWLSGDTDRVLACRRLKYTMVPKSGFIGVPMGQWQMGQPGRKAIVKEEASISDARNVSVAHTIDPDYAVQVYYNDNPIDHVAIDGTNIELENALPVLGGVTVSYTSYGIATGTYTAPNHEVAFWMNAWIPDTESGSTQEMQVGIICGNRKIIIRSEPITVLGSDAGGENPTVEPAEQDEGDIRKNDSTGIFVDKYVEIWAQVFRNDPYVPQGETEEVDNWTVDSNEHVLVFESSNPRIAAMYSMENREGVLNGKWTQGQFTSHVGPTAHRYKAIVRGRGDTEEGRKGGTVTIRAYLAESIFGSDITLFECGDIEQTVDLKVKSYRTTYDQWQARISIAFNIDPVTGQYSVAASPAEEAVAVIENESEDLGLALIADEFGGLETLHRPNHTQYDDMVKIKLTLKNYYSLWITKVVVDGCVLPQSNFLMLDPMNFTTNLSGPNLTLYVPWDWETVDSNVRVVVTDSVMGAAISGAIVGLFTDAELLHQATDRDGALVAPITTDGNGVAEFTNLPRGETYYSAIYHGNYKANSYAAALLHNAWQWDANESNDRVAGLATNIPLTPYRLKSMSKTITLTMTCNGAIVPGLVG